MEIPMQLKIVAFCAALVIAPGVHLASAQTATQADTDPQAFAEMAGSSNMFEIESSQLALERAGDEEVRAFAEKMVQDHTMAGEEMKAAAEADGVTPPTEMLEKEQTQLDQLQASEGAAFDEAYLAAQATAHEEAVALFEAFSTQGEEGALRDFAAETLPTLQEHKAQVDELAGR
jgi:putative membrane protein